MQTIDRSCGTSINVAYFMTNNEDKSPIYLAHFNTMAIVNFQMFTLNWRLSVQFYWNLHLFTRLYNSKKYTFYRYQGVSVAPWTVKYNKLTTLHTFVLESEMLNTIGMKSNAVTVLHGEYCYEIHNTNWLYGRQWRSVIANWESGVKYMRRSE